MIKKLRWRLVLLTMALLTVVIVAVIWMFIAFTYQGMKKDSLTALENAGRWYGIHQTHPDGQPPKEPENHEPGEAPPQRDKEDKEATAAKPEPSLREEKSRASGDFLKDKSGETPQSVIPCFVVGYDHEGNLYAKGPRYYDLSDTEKLEQLLLQAEQSEKKNGLLLEQNLRFLRLEEVCGQAYAFTDVTSEMDAILRLAHKSILIAVLAVVGFFLICMLMSWWATRPVAQVMEQQRQFVADASHELKTPLTVILTNAEMLDEEAYSGENRIKSTQSILTMSRQMRGLVDELLQLARVENVVQNDQKVEMNLSQLAQEQVLLFEPLYFEEGRELQSQVEENLHIQGDPERLGQVLEVLLDNGCKYSAPGSQVKLSLKRQGLKKCVITVESHGDTLTDQECRDIFKRFYRRDPNRSMNHSYGLGLSIAQSVVTQHKGKIWATSSKGTNTFHVCLPLKRS